MEGETVEERGQRGVTALIHAGDHDVFYRGLDQIFLVVHQLADHGQGLEHESAFGFRVDFEDHALDKYGEMEYLGGVGRQYMMRDMGKEESFLL